jgi:hypothetical protein
MMTKYVLGSFTALAVLVVAPAAAPADGADDETAPPATVVAEPVQDAIVPASGATLASITQFWDDFEGATPWTRWEGGGSGDGIAGYDINGGVAHSGRNDGWLYVGNGWAANRIRVNLNGFFSRSNCAAAISMAPLGSGAQVGLQIWNPTNWTIIAATYPWIEGNGTGYHQVVIDGLNLSGYRGDIYLQAIYGNSSGIKQFIRLDDMILQCSF